MADKQKLRTYSVTGRVVAILDVEVRAASFAEAVQAAAKLGMDDFVELPDHHFDSSLTIVAVSNPDGYET